MMDAVERWRSAVSTPYHEFLPDDISLLDDATVDCARLAGHRQITDTYLLALAVAHGARFVTLDRHVPLASVRSAREESLVVIPDTNLDLSAPDHGQPSEPRV